MTTSIYCVGMVSSPIPEDHEERQLRDAMGQIVTTTVQTIAQDTQMRKSESHKTVKVLSNGIWSQRDYFEILKAHCEKGQPQAKARLQEFIDANYFYHPRPTKHFSLVASSDAHAASTYCLYQLKLKRESLPSDALASLLEQREFVMLDCANVPQLGQYQALLQTIGKDKFDKLFSHKTGIPLLLSPNNADNPIDNFLKIMTVVKGEKGKRAIAVGQLLGFKNVSTYRAKHALMGDCENQNAICVVATEGQQKFVGHGLQPDGMSEEEIEQFLCDEFNSPPLSCEPISTACANKLLSAGRKINLLWCDLFVDTTGKKVDSFKNFLTAEMHISPETRDAIIDSFYEQSRPIQVREIEDPEFGFRPNIVDFNIELIRELIKMPLKKISMAFVKKFVSRQKQAQTLM